MTDQQILQKDDIVNRICGRLLQIESDTEEILRKLEERDK